MVAHFQNTFCAVCARVGGYMNKIGLMTGFVAFLCACGGGQGQAGSQSQGQTNGGRTRTPGLPWFPDGAPGFSLVQGFPFFVQVNWDLADGEYQLSGTGDALSPSSIMRHDVYTPPRLQPIDGDLTIIDWRFSLFCHSREQRWFFCTDHGRSTTSSVSAEMTCDDPGGLYLFGPGVEEEEFYCEAEFYARCRDVSPSRPHSLAECLWNVVPNQGEGAVRHGSVEFRITQMLDGTNRQFYHAQNWRIDSSYPSRRAPGPRAYSTFYWTATKAYIQ